MINSAPAQEMGAELGRLMTQGRAEMASALFGERNDFVMYGEGQKPVEVEAPQVQQEGGMEM
jgi:hypothetical protein